MDLNRIWQLGAAIVALGILALGWFLGVSPQLDTADASAQQTASLKATNDQTQVAIAKLEADQKNLPQLKSDLDALLASVPDSEAIPSFIDQLNAAATTASVSITEIKVSDAQAYQPATPPQGAASSSSSSSSSTSADGSTPAPTAAPTPAPTAVAGMPPVTNPLITSNSLAVIPLDVTVKGSYEATLQFVKNLQTGTRLYLVTKLTTSQDKSADASDGTVTVTVSGYLYSLTGTATAPVPSATPSPAATSSSTATTASS